MTQSSTISGNHLVARALRQEGVSNIFTVAGDHVLPLLDVIDGEGFRLVDTRHEQAAVHMADAWGRITGGPGVAIYTTPGLANAIPGICDAFNGESPLLSISGSAPLNELGRGAMQEIDQVGMVRPIAKGAWMVTDARRIPQMIAHALRLAYEGRRGPVHLTIPVDIQDQMVPEDEVTLLGAPESSGAGVALAPRDQVREAIGLLRTAVRPIVIAGSAAAYAETGDSLRRFIEATRLPLLTEGDARGLVSDEHPYCFGFFDNALNRAAKLLGRADVVMLLGRKQDIILGYASPPTIAPDARIIQVDPSSVEIGRNRSVSVGIAGDVEGVLDQLTEEAAGHTWRDLDWLQELRAEREAQTEWLESQAVPEEPAHAMLVHKALQPFVRPEDYLIFDGGDFCHFGRAFLPAREPRAWRYVSPLGMLGTALPVALAAKLAHPDRRVFMLTGDGAFGFNGMEFDTAVRHDLPIVAILGNDAAWGIDRQIQLGVYGRVVATDLLPTRYDQVVQGLGGYGEHVEDPSELSSAIKRALDADRPALLDVRVQRAISPRAEAAIARWQSESVHPF